MTRFDWKRFCERNHIEYVTSGPNTARGNISVHCPFCGAADPSHHLGLKLDTRDPQWGCFRNSAHRGRTPARLISKLLNISQTQAEELVKKSAPPVESLDETLFTLRNGQQPAAGARQSVRCVQPLSEFRPFSRTLPAQSSDYQKQFLTYLSRRGFADDALDAAQRYKLWYSLTGEQAWRLVFPVFSNEGGLIGWTGREIRNGAKVRYLAMPEMGKDWVMLSVRPEPADVLVICEGPLDFLKIDYYGRQFGIEACATMGTAVTPGQLVQIIRRARTKRKTFSLFDPEAFAQSLRLTFNMTGFGSVPKFHQVPADYEDPGAMDSRAVQEMSDLLAR